MTEQKNDSKDNFDDRLAKATQARKSKNEVNKDADSMSQGMRIGMEFTVTVGVSIFIGYKLDQYFETSPAFFFVFLILGFMAGVWNIYRIENNYGRAGLPYNAKNETHNNSAEKSEKNEQKENAEK